MEDFALEIAIKFLLLPYDYMNQLGDAMGEVVSGDSSTIIGTVNNMIGSKVETFFPVIQSFAFAIAMMFCLFHIVDLAASERLNLETLVKTFGQLGLAIGLIAATPTFFTKIQELGVAIANLTGSHFATSGDVLFENSDQLEERLLNIFHDAVHEHQSLIGDVIDAITLDAFDINVMGKCFLLCGACLVTTVPTILFALAMLVCVYMVGFTRIVELNIRGAFLPVGLAMLSDDGFKGAGGRYLKRFIAVCCQGMVIAFIGALYHIMYGASINNIVDTFESLDSGAGVPAILGQIMGNQVVIFGVGIACISALFKSIQLTNDVFGA